MPEEVQGLPHKEPRIQSKGGRGYQSPPLNTQYINTFNTYSFMRGMSYFLVSVLGGT